MEVKKISLLLREKSNTSWESDNLRGVADSSLVLKEWSGGTIIPSFSMPLIHLNTFEVVKHL
jgi:hypothetical protein